MARAAARRASGSIAQFTSPLVKVQDNAIHDNGAIGIDLSATLAGDGATTNDSNGHANGPSLWQNHPALGAVPRSSDGSTFTVSGTLVSPNTPNQQVEIALFANPAGTAQGATPVGTLTVTTNATGSAAFTGGPYPNPFDQPEITATATSANGTSEFSAPLISVSSAVFSDGFE